MKVQVSGEIKHVIGKAEDSAVKKAEKIIKEKAEVEVKEAFIRVSSCYPSYGCMPGQPPCSYTTCN